MQSEREVRPAGATGGALAEGLEYGCRPGGEGEIPAGMGGSSWIHGADDHLVRRGQRGAREPELDRAVAGVEEDHEAVADNPFAVRCSLPDRVTGEEHPDRVQPRVTPERSTEFRAVRTEPGEVLRTTFDERPPLEEVPLAEGRLRPPQVD